MTSDSSNRFQQMAHLADLPGAGDSSSACLRLFASRVPSAQDTTVLPTDDPFGPTLRRFAPTISDPATVQVYRAAADVAPCRLPVLITGETGVGKERLAEFIHHCSRRSRDASPFVCINCAAMNENLFESELFGYERGAFTGADRAKAGLLETAKNGTIFLDEVGELSLVLQAKLLRALESDTAIRVGGIEPRAIRVRFVSATNRDLLTEIEQGRFRRDLFHRLAGLSLHIPPLREREGEILPLAEHFARTACRELGVSPLPFSPDAIAAMLVNPWNGNIRELRHAVQRGVIFARSDTCIRAEHLRLGAPRESTPPPSRPALRQPATGEFPAIRPRQRPGRESIVQAIAECAGNQTRAATLLGVGRRTLTRWLGTLDIPRPRKG